ncbi:MAG: GtrA family protein [Candidatus Diapherotrites archaeon]|nr:GtrA family protein [Candidatus Diapherotrites archaeon]
MNFIELIRNTIAAFFRVRFFKYCFGGGISAIVDLSIFYTLNEIIGMYYIFSLICSFVVASGVNFFIQRKFTFKNNYAKKHKQLLVFTVLQAGGLAINASVTALQVEYFGVWPTFAKFCAIFVALIYNYFTSKYITFNLMK